MQAPSPADTRDWREILPSLTISSQVRFRAETRRNVRFDDALPDNGEDFLLSRFRFALTWQPTTALIGVLELQDARIFGETGTSEDRTPNIFADRLDVHQAYFDARSPVSAPGPFSLRVGRPRAFSRGWCRWTRPASTTTGSRQVGCSTVNSTVSTTPIRTLFP
ncbi:MAG: alginate export family protein [Acidobacteria bacterium]|nr:alginate export family protein [Acidobacteriota bacterium]